MQGVVLPLLGAPGWPELLLLLVVVLVIFGPTQLPKIGKALGSGIKEFKEGLRGIGEEEGEQQAAPPASQATGPSEPKSPPPDDLHDQSSGGAPSPKG